MKGPIGDKVADVVKYRMLFGISLILTGVGLAGCGSPGAQFLKGAPAGVASSSASDVQRFHDGNGDRVKRTANKDAVVASRLTQNGELAKGWQDRDSIVQAGTPPHWLSKTTPNVGSPDWKREQDETEKRETDIKKDIYGVCHGC